MRIHTFVAVSGTTVSMAYHSDIIAYAAADWMRTSMTFPNVFLARLSGSYPESE